jgi:hypothetical protein
MAASEPADTFFIGQAAVCFLIGAGTCVPLAAQIVLLALCAIVYFGMLTVTTYYGGFAVLTHSIGDQASCIAGGLMSLVVAVLLATKQQATLPVLICFLLIFAAAAVVTYFIRMRIKQSRLLLLELILDDADRSEDIRTVNQWVNVTIEGFRVGHPVCLDWSLLRWGIEKWPRSSIVWFMYAKFISIFPEQSQTLAWIYHTVVAEKVKGGGVRTVKAQSLSIARQREMNLSPELKTRLRHFTKQLTAAKHKLRRVWDLAIQSNIADMDEATKRVMEALDQCDASMRHIFRQFPNNRFVTRQYARFADELLADAPLAADMIEKSRMLQRDVPVNKDKAHEWGTHAFPNLPEKTTPERTGLAQDSVSLGEVSEVDPEGQIDGSSLIAEHIDTVTFPGVQDAMVLQLVLFAAFVCIEIPVLLVLSKVLEDNMLVPLPFFNHQALFRAEAYVVNALCQEVVYTHLAPTVADGVLYTAAPQPLPREGRRTPIASGGPGIWA